MARGLPFIEPKWLKDGARKEPRPTGGTRNKMRSEQCQPPRDVERLCMPALRSGPRGGGYVRRADLHQERNTTSVLAKRSVGKFGGEETRPRGSGRRRLGVEKHSFQPGSSTVPITMIEVEKSSGSDQTASSPWEIRIKLTRCQTLCVPQTGSQ